MGTSPAAEHQVSRERIKLEIDMTERKRIDSLAKRIVRLVESKQADAKYVEGLLEKLVLNRDAVIRELEKKARPKKFKITPRMVQAALRRSLEENMIQNTAQHIYDSCILIDETAK